MFKNILKFIELLIIINFIDQLIIIFIDAANRNTITITPNECDCILFDFLMLIVSTD